MKQRSFWLFNWFPSDGPLKNFWPTKHVCR